MSKQCEHVTANIGPNGPVKMECEARAALTITANGIRWQLCTTHAHVALSTRVKGRA